MNIRDRLYLSTIDENAAALARENGLGSNLPSSARPQIWMKTSPNGCPWRRRA